MANTPEQTVPTSNWENDPLASPASGANDNGSAQAGAVATTALFNQGDQGPLVREFQQALLDNGITSIGEVDGVYGRKTAAAIQEYQALAGLPRTGILDSVTYERLVFGEPIKPVEQPSSQGVGQSTSASGGVSTLLDFISSGEGTYDSYNSGTVNGKIQHWSHNYNQEGQSLSSMTIGQIREKMNIGDPRNPDRIFAAGRYQVIPSTLNAAAEALGLSDNTVFNQETQDQIGLFLVSEKRPRVGAYLAGDNVSVETAMLDLAKEFASFPVPMDIKAGTYGSWPKRDIQAGESFYATARSGAGTNRAGHSVEETRSLLESIRGQ